MSPYYGHGGGGGPDTYGDYPMGYRKPEHHLPLATAGVAIGMTTIVVVVTLAIMLVVLHYMPMTDATYMLRMSLACATLAIIFTMVGGTITIIGWSREDKAAYDSLAVRFKLHTGRDA